MGLLCWFARCWQRGLATLSFLLLMSCGAAPDGDLPEPAVGRFVLEEATMAQVHEALAGQRRLETGERLSCERLVQMYINRIAAYNNMPQPNGGLPVRGVLAISNTALPQARELDALYAHDEGIADRYLHCMPVLLKDNFDTYDQPSTQGSFSMLNHQAGVDAHSVAGLRAAGAVILGKANQDEFAYFNRGFSARAIQVSNPYNTSQSPAGSSSGTGASLAANFALGGTGTDTCQSIRHPSSVNGLVGIRPSIGVVSAHGIFPLSHGRDVAGPMTRSVTDAALMLSAMAGVDPRDPRTFELPHSQRPTDYSQYLDRDQHGLAGRNIGVLRLLGDSEEAAGTGQQGELINAAVADMRALGADIYDVYLPDFEALEVGSRHYDVNEYFAQFELEGGSSPRACLSQLRATETHGRDKACRTTILLTPGGILESGLVGLRSLPLLARTALASPDRAPSAEELQVLRDIRAYVTAEMDVLKDQQGMPVTDQFGNTIRLDAIVLSPGPTGGRTCELGSTTQMASIVVPIGFDSSVAGPLDSEGRGVPRGIEILVRRFDEGSALGIAYDYEQATRHRAPPRLLASPFSEEAAEIGVFNALQNALLGLLGVRAEDD